MADMAVTSVELLTPGEAARLLRVSERTVRRLLVAGDLDGFRVGAQWRVDRTALDARLLPAPPRHFTTHNQRKS